MEAKPAERPEIHFGAHGMRALPLQLLIVIVRHRAFSPQRKLRHGSGQQMATGPGVNIVRERRGAAKVGQVPPVSG